MIVTHGVYSVDCLTLFVFVFSLKERADTDGSGSINPDEF